MKIFLAPMEGVVDAVVRDLFSRIGGFDLFVTEFVRVTQQLLPAHVFYRYCPELRTGGRTQNGTPVYIQLLGGDPELLGENAALAVELGALGIDLNFGCPAKTVNRHDGGATLLKNPERLFDVITAVKRQVPAGTPVTAKVRLGFENKDLVKEIAMAVDQAQADHLIVHARTKTEGYRPPAHWEYIAQMKEVARLPIIANGEIWSLADYERCLEITGCESVALGRTAMSCPDLALQIKTRQAAWQWPQVFQLLSPFVTANNEYRGEMYALCKAKQWCKFLSRNYPEAASLFDQLKLCKSLDQLNGLLQSCQEELLETNQGKNKTTRSEITEGFLSSSSPITFTAVSP